MAILNYTTQIDAAKTVMEIQKLLASKKALSINVDYDDQTNPIALTFLIFIKDTPVNFRLPSNHLGVFRKLKSDIKVPNKLKTEEQALRVSWRIRKDWIEAQMAMIESEQAELAEIFLPYAVTKTGATLYQLAQSDIKLLTGG